MLHEALVALRAGRSAMRHSYFVGDTASDLRAAHAAGVRRVLVGTGYGEAVLESLRRHDHPIPCMLVGVGESAPDNAGGVEVVRVSAEEASALGVPAETLPVLFAADIGDACDAMCAIVEAATAPAVLNV